LKVIKNISELLWIFLNYQKFEWFT
jgi:hypothetical protein